MNEDERIERALGLLTKAEAPDGLEERVLRRLAERRVVVRRRWFGPVVAAVAVLALVVGLRHHPKPVVVVPVGKDVAAAQVVRPGDTHVSEARHGAPRVVRVRAVAEKQVSFPAPVAPLTEQEKLLVKLAEARRREATPQIEIATAARKPKHEVALTHEEMLLVAISHVRQDAVIDALDPVRRAEAEAREKREFKAYVRQKDGGSDEIRP